ncbi:MAG: restriction endonuclease [Phycisphaerae bacterium]|nr:restriction endonuclease [Phycisphaerae bacterium]
MKKPVPEDFGLTAEEYEKAVKKGFPTLADFPAEKISKWAKCPVIISSIVCGVIIGLIVWLLAGDAGVSPLGVVFGPLIGLYFGSMICGRRFESLSNEKELASNERFRQAEELSRPLREKVENYEKAQRDYQLSLEKAQQDYQRRREQYWEESLRGVEFEEELACLYSKLGYAVEVTKGSGDDGVDLFLRNDEEVIVVQCKGHGKPIGVGAIRDLYGAMIHFEANSAVLACPSGFTAGVLKFAADKPMQLISATDLVEMMESIGNC